MKNPEVASAATNRWRENNKERHKKTSLAWKKAHPEYQKRWRSIDRNGRRNSLKRHYGITLAEYDDMLISQGGSCAICAGSANGTGKTFYVDHDHRTGHIRGLLCHNCNTALGLVKDSTERLQKLIDYIRPKLKVAA